MARAIYLLVLITLIGAAALLASRATSWRDPHWVGVLGIITVTAFFAYEMGRWTTN